MKLSDLKGEAALDALAEMLEPASEIMTDAEFIRNIREGDRMTAAKVAIKNHKKAIIAIMAATEGVKPEDYEVNLLTLPMKLIEILNDPEITGLFQSQGQTKTFSGSATENTEAEEK